MSSLYRTNDAFESTHNIAIGMRLAKCRNVITIGFKPNFSDYSDGDAKLIQNADKIFYPTAFYADIFEAMGKKIFPSLNTYAFVQDKIRQSAMFNMHGIPHPFTKVFYGNNQKKKIMDFFNLPFIAKNPRGSSMGRGVYLILCQNDLKEYLTSNAGPAYIQQYCPHDKDIRVVVIGKKVVLAYWRIIKGMDFRANISCGGDISFNDLPGEALSLALKTAIKCQWDDVGIDLVEHKGQFMVIEANMKYGKKGFIKAGINYHNLLENLIAKGDI
ncbi:RimK1 (fragment) [Desulfamplus magnetovallimortis]|uniref:RimK1 n=1 Tax=Desulfamplus magnetovallimortis TaxID=1246637 RepID=A0A1W1HLA4_9BACT